MCNFHENEPARSNPELTPNGNGRRYGLIDGITVKSAGPSHKPARVTESIAALVFGNVRLKNQLKSHAL